MESKIVATLAFGVILMTLLGVFASAASNTENYKLIDASKKPTTGIVYASSEGSNSGSENTLEAENEVEDETSSGGGTTTIDGTGTTIIEPTKPYPYPSKVDVEISPEKIVSENGREKYDVVVKDLHKLKLPDCDSEAVACTQNSQVLQSYEYKLSFYSKHGLQGEFEEDEILLTPGESKTVALYVQAEKKGAKIFEVTVKGEDSFASAKGLLVYGEDGYEEPTAYFVGEGFAFNSDSSRGKLLHLVVLKTEEKTYPQEIRGKMSFGEKVFQLKGTLANDEMKFRLYEVNDVGVSIGEFEGDIEKYEDFLYLEGKLNFEIFTSPDDEWYINAISKRQSVFKPVIIDEGGIQVTETVGEGEIIAITETSEEETTSEGKREIYISPGEVRKEFFGYENDYIGNKILKIEVTNEDGVTTTTKLRENSETKVGDYRVSVGSFATEGNYEIGVERAS